MVSPDEREDLDRRYAALLPEAVIAFAAVLVLLVALFWGASALGLFP